MQQETMQPGDEVTQMLMDRAHEISRELCPVCHAPIIVRNAEAICTSDICRERKIESCDGC